MEEFGTFIRNLSLTIVFHRILLLPAVPAAGAKAGHAAGHGQGAHRRVQAEEPYGGADRSAATRIKVDGE